MNVTFPRVESRKEYMDFLAGLMSSPEKDDRDDVEHRGRHRQLKTFIVESNSQLTNDFHVEGLTTTIIPTGVPDLRILNIVGSNLFAQFYLDTSDSRFWVLNTNVLSNPAKDIVKKIVHSHDHQFDRTWFSTSMLRDVTKMEGNVSNGFKLDYQDLFFSTDPSEAKVEDLAISISGRSSYKALNAIRTEEDFVNSMAYTRVRLIRGPKTTFAEDDLSYYGMFVVKRGTSIDHHMQLVEKVRTQYHDKMEEIEDYRIGVKTVEERTLTEGKAFDFEFDRTIEDWNIFFQRLTSRSFRIWGLKTKIHEDFYQLTAVDLHTGDPFDLEISRNQVRAYIPKGSCGNIVLRLLVNLQQKFDSKISCPQIGIDGSIV